MTKVFQNVPDFSIKSVIFCALIWFFTYGISVYLDKNAIWRLVVWGGLIGEYSCPNDGEHKYRKPKRLQMLRKCLWYFFVFWDHFWAMSGQPLESGWSFWANGGFTRPTFGPFMAIRHLDLYLGAEIWKNPENIKNLEIRMAPKLESGIFAVF